jgi:hypothetical protein
MVMAVFVVVGVLAGVGVFVGVAVAVVGMITVWMIDVCMTAFGLHCPTVSIWAAGIGVRPGPTNFGGHGLGGSTSDD